MIQHGPLTDLCTCVHINVKLHTRVNTVIIFPSVKLNLSSIPDMENVTAGLTALWRGHSNVHVRTHTHKVLTIDLITGIINE